MNKIKVINRVTHSVIDSNIVYPAQTINWICVVDNNWLQNQLTMHCGVARNGSINNKYLIECNGNYYYRHDNNTWLVTFKDNIKQDDNGNVRISNEVDIEDI